MGRFSDPLDLRWVGVAKGTVVWELIQPLSYVTDAGETIVVPAGFQTDLASVPRVLWIWLPPDWKYTKAAILHDYLIVSKVRSWDEANKLFHEGMRTLNVNKNTNWIMYKTVCFWRWFKIAILGK